MEKFAGIISYLLHPVFIPPLMAYFIFQMKIYPFSFYSVKATYLVVFLTMVFNVITPMLLIFLMKRAALIGSVILNTKRERILPLFIFAMLLYMNAIISKNWSLPALWEVTLLLMAMVSLITLFVSFFYKISLHMVGWGGLTGLFIALIYTFNVDYFLFLTISILLSGMVAWSRSMLKKHKAGEIIFGFVLGCIGLAGGLLFLMSLNKA